MSAKRKYFGHAAHFICGDKCQWHLATQVGRYIVSSVGELWPERSSREIHAKIYDPKWLAENQQRKGDEFDFHYRKRFGFDEIGCGRKYETMVFKIDGTKKCECGCGLPKIIPSEMDSAGYNDAVSATKGHEAMCRKWENGKPSEVSA